MTATANPITEFISRNRGLLFPAAAASLIFVILIPLPTLVLDFLLTLNILLSAVVLITVMYLGAPTEFSSFPSLLLALTLLRLVLNVATTRLILTNTNDGTSAAGHVVEAFGTFVAGNSLPVGVIIFVIITVIQFVVITKGATRIAEVAARFALDGMPGKQMAIDADLNAGAIDDKEARRRRAAVAQEADFFGAMDGASKFVRGDAIAGILITLVNVLGGLYVGSFEGGLPIMQSLEQFTKLSIGDGLSSQVPAFIISIAAAMLVTRNSAQSNMGEDVLKQLLGKPVALGLAATFLSVMILTPLPKIPIITLAAGCGLLAFIVRRHRIEAVALAAQTAKTESARPKPAAIEDNLHVDAMELQIGFGLVRLVDRARGGDVLDRIAGLRKQIAADLGIVLPPIRIHDNATLEPNAYSFLLRGQEIARGELHPDQLLAIDAGITSEPIGGIATQEPAFQLPAWWIPESDRERAERLGYTVVEPSGVLITHLTELAKRHAPDLLTRADTQKLLDHLKQSNAGLYDEVIPSLMKVGEVQKVLQNLLRERVPVRDLEAILETLGDWAPKTKDPEILTEYVRHTLARTICGQYRDAQGCLNCITLDPRTEDYIQGNIRRTEHGSTLAIPPDRQSELLQKVRAQLESASATAGGTVAIVCSPPVRLWVRRMLETVLPQTPVLGLNELVRGVDVRAHGVVSINV
jgi:flagellar biosynthesis protein FlhA